MAQYITFYGKAHLFSLIIYAYDHKILQCCCILISEVHSLALDVNGVVEHNDLALTSHSK